MADIFQKLKFDDREIETSIINMMKGMSQVQAKAKEVSIAMQEDFKKSQSSIASENKTNVKSQIDALNSFEKAVEQLQQKILSSSTSAIEFLKIEDPREKIEVAKAIALEKIDQMVAELRERAKSSGETLPINFEANIEILKKETIQEFDKQIKEFEGQTKKLDSKWSGFLKGFGEKAKPVFSKVGSLLIGTLKATGLITAGATVAAIFTGIAKKAIEAFSKTEDGAKKLKGVQEQFAKLKAVGQDFANRVISAFLPLIEKVFPYIVKGAVLAASHFRGMQAVAISLGHNVVSAFKRIGNGIEIIGLKAKNFLGLGDEESKQRVLDLQAENEKLKNGIINVGTAYKEAFIAQYESGTKIAANTKLNTTLTDKQREAIRKLREEYKKMLEDFGQKVETANLKLLEIENPLTNIEVQKAIALDAIDKLEREIREKAKQTGQKLPVTFEAEIELLKDAAIAEFDAEMAKLEDEIYQKAIKNSEVQIPLKVTTTIDLIKEQNDLQKSVSVFRDATGKLLSTGIQEKLDKETKDTVNKLVLKIPKIKPDPNAKKSFGEALSRLFPEEDDLRELSGAFVDSFAAINQIIIDSTSSQIEQNNRLIDSIRDRLSSAESSLRREEELQRNGSANNVATKKREIAALKVEEQRAIKENEELNRKRVKQQLIQDGLTQASNLVTAGTNLFARESLSKGAAGIIFATLAITSMLAFFARLKSQAKGAAEIRAHKGGPIERYITGWVNKDSGRTDRFGGRGHRIEDSSLIVGGREFIVNEETSTRHPQFLEDLNRGKYDGIDLKTLIRRKSESANLTELLRNVIHQEESVSSTFGRTSHQFIQSFREDVRQRFDMRKELKDLKKVNKKFNEQRTNEFITKKDLEKMMKDHLKGIRRVILEEKPDYFPIDENTIGYIKKTPDLSERILFEKTKENGSNKRV